MSGALVNMIVASPTMMAGTPASRQRRCQRHSQRPPIVTIARPTTGIAGTTDTAFGKPATYAAIAMMASTPHPIGTSATSSRPNGIRMTASTAHGMIHKPVSGTAIMLAATP